MANNHSGYKRKPAKTKGNLGNLDMELESFNPYEFKKGMNYELRKMGILAPLRETSEEDREKATESVIKNLKETPAYYSYLEHYETTTRNMDKKPSFKSFLKELDGYSMKEVKEKFDNDKMKEIKLKESIRAEIRNKINEILGNDLSLYLGENKNPMITDQQKKELLSVAETLRKLVKIHDAVKGTKLLADRMGDRDTLMNASYTLEKLANK